MKLVLHLVLASLLAATTAWAEPSLDELCRSAGGVPSRGDCLCFEGDLYIDPSSGSQMCPVRALDEAARAVEQWIKIPSCPEEPHPADRVFRPYLVGIEELCGDPARYLCDKNLNPAVGRKEEIRQAFLKLVADSELDPKVVAFKRTNGGKQDTPCRELGFGKYKGCRDLADRALWSVLNDEGRSKRAMEIFARARDAVVKTLTEKEKDLRNAKRDADADKVLAMISRVRDAVAITGSERPEFMAAADREENGLDLSGRVYLAGYMLLATEMPGHLFLTLMHELSHLADDDGADRDAHASERGVSPFEPQVSCLMREDAAFAKKSDWSCVSASVSASDGIFDPDRARFVGECVNKLRRFPRSRGTCFVASCQSGQVAEAFGDWLATEAYVAAYDTNLRKAQAGSDAGSGDGATVDLAEKLKQNPLLAEIAADCQSYDRLRAENVGYFRPHLPMEKRVNSIFFSHPRVKAALGCPARLTPVVGGSEKSYFNWVRMGKFGERLQDQAPAQRNAYCPPSGVDK